jgi:hypothetical protein
MAKKNEVVKKTPEMLAKAQERMIAIDASIEEHLNLASKGYLAIAPLIAEVYDNDYFVVKGYKNIDQYAEAEHAMSHGTVSGLRKVFARFGSTKENEDGTKSYTIPDKYLDWGYTKLHLIASDEQKFKDAGIEPFEVFTPDMTIKAMKDTLALKLEDKAKDQDANAIDTTAKEVDNGATATAEADKASATATAESRNEDFSSYLAKLKQASADLSAFSKNEPKEVVQVIDTILGYIKTLESTYNKAHATATPKDPKKNK